MRIEPVFLFDLDGTLVDSVYILGECWRFLASTRWVGHWVGQYARGRAARRLCASPIRAVSRVR
jgi:beta-phosphoglucomutase-like phosphatase (HAD superfamily)